MGATQLHRIIQNAILATMRWSSNRQKETSEQPSPPPKKKMICRLILSSSFSKFIVSSTNHEVSWSEWDTFAEHVNLAYAGDSRDAQSIEKISPVTTSQQELLHWWLLIFFCRCRHDVHFAESPALRFDHLCQAVSPAAQGVHIGVPSRWAILGCFVGNLKFEDGRTFTFFKRLRNNFWTHVPFQMRKANSSCTFLVLVSFSCLISLAALLTSSGELHFPCARWNRENTFGIV